MRPALLDVNVLIGLLDAHHVHHQSAMDWLGRYGQAGWASCPITENGCARIMSHPGYPHPRSPTQVAQRLRDATRTGLHRFWPDDLTLLDEGRFNWETLLHSRQLTDAYFLALAVKHNGVFATFGQGVALKGVSGAGPEHLVRI